MSVSEYTKDLAALYRRFPECEARACDIRWSESMRSPTTIFTHEGANGVVYEVDNFIAACKPEVVTKQFRDYARTCHERMDEDRPPSTTQEVMAYVGTPDMVPTPQRWEKAKLGAVACAMCGKPVAWQDHKTDKSLAGGKCLSDTCRPGKNGRERDVFTFVRIVHALDL